MGERHLLIIGGGLAGLAAGCYARHNGYRVTIFEHNTGLGGVCSAWRRDAYLVDGCIHWLVGGPFERLYHELGIVPRVALRPLEHWVTWRDARDGLEVPITRDLDALVGRLAEIAPRDAPELERLRRGANDLIGVEPRIDAPELASVREHLRELWQMRTSLPSVMHFRRAVGDWARENLESEQLRRLFTHLMPEGTSCLFLLIALGYLGRGWMSRPVGGTAAFRDALIARYAELGGEVALETTVEEVLVESGRAVGLRMADGTIVRGHAVLSTASMPETVLRLLGGRFDAAATHQRLDRWKLYEPIVLASFGVAEAYASAPSLLSLSGLEPFELGGRERDAFEVRVCNDDPCFAPAGHTVVQALVGTSYEWWATRGDGYRAEKERAAERLLAQLEPWFPGIRGAVRMIDIATPLTYWNAARAWRGAFEGWRLGPETFFTHVKKTLAGLERFYMAGQWVEPGGGVPIALMSGRQAVQLLCEDDRHPFLVAG